MNRPFFLLIAVMGVASAQETFSLSQALTEIEKNPAVVAAQLSARSAELQRNNLLSGLRISVNANAGYATSNPIQSSVGVQGSLGVLPWSGSQQAQSKAERQLRLAQARLKETRLNAQTNVIQTYFTAALAEIDLELAQKNVIHKQRLWEVGKQKFQQNNLTSEQLFSLEIAFQQAQATVRQMNLARDYSRHSLAMVLDKDVQTLMNVTLDTLPKESFEMPMPDWNVQQASEVILANNTLMNARESLAQLQRDLFPQVAVKMNYGGADDGLQASFDLKQGTVSAGYTLPTDTKKSVLAVAVSGNYTIYAPAARAELAAAEAEVKQAEISLHLAKQNKQLDLRSQYNTAQNNLMALQAAQGQLKLAQLNRDTLKKQLEAGLITQDEFHQSELNLLEAQRNIIQARLKAQVSLYPFNGGL